MGQRELPTDIGPWPQDLLRRIDQVHHNPPSEELPCAYKFAVLYRDEIQTEMERGPNAGTFDTLEEATKAAFELFGQLTWKWGVNKEETVSFYETDDWMRLVDDEIEEPMRHRPRDKQVNWNINARGLLSMASLDFMGMQARVVVCDFQVEEEDSS